MELFTQQLIRLGACALPLLALWLLIRCMLSMLGESDEGEIWAYFETSAGETAVIRHWEALLGRAKSCDVVVDLPAAAGTQAALIRDHRGEWTLYELDGGVACLVNGQRDSGSGLPLREGDRLSLSGTELRFHALTEGQRSAVDSRRSTPGRRVSPSLTLLVLTLFQCLLALSFTFSTPAPYTLTVTLGFAALALLQWCCYFITRSLDRSGFELETLAFFLSTLGLAVVATAAPDGVLKQLLLLVAGLVLFLLLGWWLRDIGRTKLLRGPVAVLALLLLAVNLLLGETSYGAANWLTVGGVTLQPSELVKIAFIYTGAATLDRLFRGRNLFAFLAFSALCVGALALMGDFGTALIFFVTFLVIAFMRSGSFATVFLAVAGAALGVMLVLTVKPYIAQRFATWGHVWDDPYGAGWQQTQALSAAASGGLFGIGAGQGWLKHVFAADTDLVFCLLCEELGLLLALCAMSAIVLMAVFAVRSAAGGRSSFYVIAACAASAMMLVQLALNVFGSVDLLPFTGVTFPFVSRGGSSLISCWGLLAFLKAADTRRGASFSVKLSSRKGAAV